MKLIHLATASYATLAGMIAHQFYKLTDSKVEGVMDNICFIHMEASRPDGGVSMPEIAPAQTLEARPLALSESVRFSNQLAIMQQSLNRASMPVIVRSNQLDAVPQSVRSL